MNHSIITADRIAHLKIVAVVLVWAILVTNIAIVLT